MSKSELSVGDRDLRLLAMRSKLTVSRVVSALRIQCCTRMPRSVATTSQYLFGVYLRRLSMPERSISPLARTMSKDIIKISVALSRSSGLKRCQHVCSVKSPSRVFLNATFMERFSIH